MSEMFYKRLRNHTNSHIQFAQVHMAEGIYNVQNDKGSKVYDSRIKLRRKMCRTGVGVLNIWFHTVVVCTK